MSENPLVSILTPCYNGTDYIDRYFEAVIGQTYPSIELIFVDDGSTDDTLAKAEAWRGRLEERGITFKLLTHPNGGQASAINLGLPEVTGKYITWPDSDDVMDSRNIELKVEYLEAHPEKGLVVCDVAKVYENDLNSEFGRIVFNDANARLFDGLIREKKDCFCSGLAYLARAEALFAAIGGRYIYESPSGQNWQLLFPLTYHNDCGFIHEVLATYVVRRDSHSHSYITPDEQMRRTYELEDIIRHVLPIVGMSEADRELYRGYMDVKYLPSRFVIAVRKGDKKSARQFKDELDLVEGPSPKRGVLMMLCETGLSRVGYRCLCCLKEALWDVKCLFMRGRWRFKKLTHDCDAD